MATHWEHLAGDTSAFAIKLAFMDDPDEQQGASDDVSLSWGAFQIWVNGWNLCTHLEEGERVESAHWYLLPLLEWFVLQWNPLLHEERLPCEAADEAWTGLRGTRFPPPALDEGQRLRPPGLEPIQTSDCGVSESATRRVAGDIREFTVGGGRVVPRCLDVRLHKKCLHFSWQAFPDMAAELERGRVFGIIEDLVRWENTAL